MGYIVPADAPLPGEDERGFSAKALDMQMIEVYARRIQAKHALFLFDSCFSGVLFAVARAAPEYITHKTAHPVRQFITSGSANEHVPDTSVFCQQFIAALHGEGDKNSDGYVTGAELGMFLEDSVINYTRGAQHSQYGKIRDRYLDKGDFVFKLLEQEEDETTVALDSSLNFPWMTLKESRNISAAWKKRSRKSLHMSNGIFRQNSRYKPGNGLSRRSQKTILIQAAMKNCALQHKIKYVTGKSVEFPSELPLPHPRHRHQRQNHLRRYH
ncbi:MAG: hypothetical protein GY801_24300 [bacterium]|nr:hypothetical protein [bacterium]